MRTVTLVLWCLLALACQGAAPAPAVPAGARRYDAMPARWSDAWILQRAPRYLANVRHRRRVLEASLTNPDNVYSRARLSSYALDSGGWDALPEWNPRVAPVTASTVAALREDGELDLAEHGAPLWNGETPTSMAAWVELGRRTFFDYPLRPEIFARHALANPDVARRVGLGAAADGTWPGVVAFQDVDGRARVGITCALCHVAIEDGTMVVGRARRNFDYGEMRLAYHRDTGAPLPEALARRMAHWGPGRADITEDEDEDPVAIVDLWGVRSHAYLTQSGTLRHVGPAALAIRQETQILHTNRERTRPPRELAWALAMYVYSLTPPDKPTPIVADAHTVRGRQLFGEHCRSCHADVNGGGTPIPARVVGTDPTLAMGHARGTGLYRPSPLTRVADAAPYLHHGVVPNLQSLLDPKRSSAVPGHRYGTGLSDRDRSALVAYLTTL